MPPSMRKTAGATFGASALVATSLVVAPTAAAGAVGDETLELPITDSVSGAAYDQSFERAYAGETPEGTPVYIYVPEGTPLDGSAPDGVASLDPAFDPDDRDAFTPCTDSSAADHTVTQEQIDYVGDLLANQIVAVDEAHFGTMGQADPNDPDSAALALVVYNVQDEMYYDCTQTSYTAGYFAPWFIDTNGMNVIVSDALDWTNRIGDADSPWNDGDPENDSEHLYEGVVAHELQHLLLHYADSDEESWVNEGLADMAGWLNGFGANSSHGMYHQVFYAETSLTEWGGGLQDYGAAYTFMQYLWERAGGNGDGSFDPDLEYDGAGGDLLIKKIFENPTNSVEGVQAAIDEFNTETGADLPGFAEMYQDWSVAVYLDDEDSELWDLKAADFGDPDYTTWTMDLADDQYWGGRGSSQGAQPDAKWSKRENAQSPIALPYGLQVERFRNPGPRVSVALDGVDETGIAAHSGDTHWYAGRESQSDNLLEFDTDGDVTSFDFWSWHFIEEGWDFGYVEALVGDEWQTVPVVDDAGSVITTNEDPHGNNTEGNGITGTSGGEYFVDEPRYVHLTAQLPAGSTDVRLRYSTDAAYVDTGWFVDDAMVDGSAATPTSERWSDIRGYQDNNWSLQVVSSCDLTPGEDTVGEIADGAGNYVYRLTGDDVATATLDTKCANGPNRDFATLVSNLPTGEFTTFDAGYDLHVEKRKKH